MSALKRRGVALALVCSVVSVAGVGLFVASILLSGCAPVAVLDEGSPRCTGSSVIAGSDLTEDSQYVEIRLTFDRELEASGQVADDLKVLVNGEDPDSRTLSTEASVDGHDLVVRVVPTSAAAAGGASSSVYYALYDGQVSVDARAEDGGLPHVRAAGSSSNAVLDSAATFTVPSGVRLGAIHASVGDGAAGTAASVSFDIEQFAQLRCCTWYSFGDKLPAVMMHNHEFSRDTLQTCAKRLADTVNANYGDSLVAEVDGARVTVRARDVVDGQELSASVLEGPGVNPTAETVENAGQAMDQSSVTASTGAAGDGA